jgi:peroxin-19
MDPVKFAPYVRQQTIVKQLIRAYESKPSDFENILTLMQDLQDCGQPPQELMKKISPNLQFGADGAPVFPDFGGKAPNDLENCTIQ